MPSTIASFFFFNDTATTEIYTLSLHDALPIYPSPLSVDFDNELQPSWRIEMLKICFGYLAITADRKSTRLNSSHLVISYAVFCLKKKKIILRASRSVTTPTQPSPQHMEPSPS